MDNNIGSITLKELFKIQEDLNSYLIEISNINKSEEEMLSNLFLALQVEVGELANATRCFKYWSRKSSDPKERLLEEYADILHFVLNIGNTLGFTASEVEKSYLSKNRENYIRQFEGY